MEGTVKWFNTKKGYGFIIGEDEQEYFVHYSMVEPESTRLKDDDKVSFEPTENDKGKQAQKVQVVSEE